MPKITAAAARPAQCGSLGMTNYRNRPQRPLPEVCGSMNFAFAYNPRPQCRVYGRSTSATVIVIQIRGPSASTSGVIDCGSTGSRGSTDLHSLECVVK